MNLLGIHMIKIHFERENEITIHALIIPSVAR